MKEQVLENFNNGYNCGQAIFVEFAEKYGLDRKTAIQLGCCLGSGYRMGEICGAATGALHIISLATAPDNVTQRDEMAVCGRATLTFLNEFQRRFSYLRCADLLDISAKERNSLSKEKQQEIYKPKCNVFVGGAVDLLEEMGY